MRSKSHSIAVPSCRKISGQGMTEYIIIVALIAIASVAAVGVFGDSVQASFVALSSELTGGTVENPNTTVSESLGAARDAAAAATTLQNYGN